MFFKPRLKDIYKEYMDYEEYMGYKGHIVYKKYPIGRNCFDRIPHGKQVYKKKIIEMFKNAIQEKNPLAVQFCISAASRDGIDADYTRLFKDIILEQWHDEQEDIVSIVCLYIPSDIFTESLRVIVMNPDKYMKYDDELEPTLRKCVCALKAIGTPETDTIIEELIKTGNQNVYSVLGMHV